MKKIFVTIYLVALVSITINYGIVLGGDDVPDLPWNAVNIGCGEYTYQIDSADDLDFFKITLKEDATFLLNGDAEEKIDFDIRNYDEDYSGYFSEYLTFYVKLRERYVHLSAGVYILVVKDSDSYVDSPYSYTFRIDSPKCFVFSTEGIQNPETNDTNSEDGCGSYDEGYQAGLELCRTNPEQCGISTGCSESDLESAKQEGYNVGYNHGYADGRASVDCSSDINASTGCSMIELIAAREEGRQECIDNPSNCGIEECSSEPISSTSYCGSYDFLTNILHIPCVEAGDTSYWLDFSYTGNGLLFDIVNYGTMFSPEQCPTLTTREECEAHSDVCRVEFANIMATVTGYGFRCVPR